MERVINLCREIIENPLLPVGKVKSRITNNWILYIRGSTFYDIICKCYAKRYNDRYSNPYLANKYVLFKTIRQAYKTRLEIFTARTYEHTYEKVYSYKFLQELLSEEPINTAPLDKVKHRRIGKKAILDKLDYIISLLEK